MEDILNFILNAEEGANLELKEAKTEVPLSFYETYSAFANTSGGRIFLGVKEVSGKPNEIVGVDDPKSEVKAIFSTLENKGKCSLNLLREKDVLIHVIKGKSVIEVSVKEAPISQKPIYLNGSFNQSYRRKGEGDFLLSEDEVAYLINNRYERKYDSKVNSFGISLSDLDHGSIESYRRDLQTSHPEIDWSLEDDISLLKRVGAFLSDESGKEGLTNGAVAFFGHLPDILRVYPAYFLDYQRYDMLDSERWSKRITSDDFNIPGNIYSFFQSVKAEIKPHLPNPFKREGETNLDGNDIYEAILEGVADALSNAAYNLQGGVLLKQTPTSFLFRNQGRVIVGLEQAKQGGVSLPRNPTIFNFFRFIGVTEKAGLGIPKIYGVAKRYSFREPSLSENANLEMTSLEFSFLPLPDSVPSSSLKKRIVSFLGEKGGEYGISEIASALGVSRTAVLQSVRELILMGILKENGKTRKGRKVSLSQ